MILEFSKSLGLLFSLASLHPSSPPLPEDSAMSTPAAHNGPAFSRSFGLRSSTQDNEKDMPLVSGLRIRTESRDHRAEGKPSPGMRAQMGDTPRKQARKPLLRATDTSFAILGQNFRERVKTKSIPWVSQCNLVPGQSS